MAEEKVKEQSEISPEIHSITHFTHARELPSVCFAGCFGVKINPLILRFIHEDYFEPFNQGRDLIKTDKFQFKSGGDWDITVSMMKSKFFDDREAFDSLIISRDRQQNYHKPSQIFERISIKNAFKFVGVEICANLEYFFAQENKADLKKYLKNGEYDPDFYSNSYNEKKLLEAKGKQQKSEYFQHLKKEMEKVNLIILHQLLIEMFGDNGFGKDDDDEIYLEDFCILASDGNFKYASASKGSCFVGFSYGTS